MIWVTDSRGAVTYVGSAWEDFTGQSPEHCLGDGWLSAVHRQDRECILPVFRSAVRAECAFTIQYRLAKRDGSYAWVMSGAVPSFDQTGGSFIGYLGSITTMFDETVIISRAGGRLGSFDPPPRLPLDEPGGTLDLIADHLLIAYALATEDGGKSVLPPLRQALLRIGVELAEASRVSTH